MRKMLFVVLLAVLMAGCTSTPEEKIADSYRSGVRQLDRYNFDAARAEFAKIREIDPNSPYTFFARGLVYERQLSYFDALHEFMLAREADPDFAPASEGVARIFALFEEREEAGRAAMDYEKLLPDDPRAKLRLAEAFIDYGDFGRAKRVVTLGVQAGMSEALASALRARICHLDHKPDSAYLYQREALADPEESPEFYYHVARMCLDADRTDSAMAFSRRAVELSGNSPLQVLRHFHLAIRQGYYWEARQAMALVSDAENAAIVRRGMEVFYDLSAGKRTAARKSSMEFRRMSEESLTSVYYDLQAQAVGADHLSVMQDLSIIPRRLETGHFLEDFSNFMMFKLATNVPETVPEQETLKLLDEIKKEWSNRMEGRLKKLYLQFRVGLFDEFDEGRATTVKYHKYHPDWLTGLADVYLLGVLRKYDEASQLYTQALENDPWYLPAFEHLVGLHRSLREYGKALKTFQAYPHMAVAYPDLMVLNACVLAENGKTDAAMTAFGKGIGYVTGDLAGFEGFIDVLRRQDKPALIRKVADMLVDMGANNPDALSLAARTFCDLGDCARALELARQGLAIEPDNSAALVQASRARYWTGEKEAALAEFEDRAVRERNNLDNNYYYARVLATDGIDLSKASNLARAAVFSAPDDLETLLNLSYVYYQAGRYDLSGGEATRASRAFPLEPQPWYRLGMAQLREGDSDARANLEKAVELGLWGSELAEARKALQDN